MDERVTGAVSQLKNSLERLNIRVKRIVLYGSWASGRATEHSDIDVVVISDDFKGMDIVTRLETIGLALANARVTEPIEALGYTEEEYHDSRQGTFIADEVRARGVQVA